MTKKAVRLYLVFLLIPALLVPSAAKAAEEVDLGIITVKSSQEAEAVRQKLSAGAVFEDLARQVSVGPTAIRGGRLGRVPLKRLRSEYRQALQGLAPGKPSAVVPTEEGYNVLMLFGQAAVAETAPAASTPEFAMESSGPADTEYLVARREVMAGVESLGRGNLEESEGHFSKALGYNPYEDGATFLLNLTRDARKQGVKNDAVALFGQGFMSMSEGNLEEAYVKFKESSAADAGLWQADLMQANILAGRGERAEARKLLNGILVRNPQAARAYLTLGQLAMEQGDNQEAERLFKTAIKLNEALAQAHYKLGYLAVARQNPEEALRCFKAAVAADPYMEEAYNDLGLIYMYSGRNEEAEKSFKRTLDLNPDYAAAHVNLGNLYARKKAYNKAIEQFRMALDINPNLGPVHGNLATAYMLEQDWPKAIHHADMAIKLGYKMPEKVMAAIKPHRK